MIDGADVDDRSPGMIGFTAMRIEPTWDAPGQRTPMRALMVAQIKRLMERRVELCLPFTLDARLGIIILYGAAVDLAAKALNARQAW